MDYRETFVNRCLETLNTYKGTLPPEVRSVVQSLGNGRTAQQLTTGEFNTLQDAASRIDTQRQVEAVNKTVRKKR